KMVSCSHAGSRVASQSCARGYSAGTSIPSAESQHHQPQRSSKTMNITRRIHLNPQSKGNLGKSLEAEFRTAWLDRLGIPWNGSDLDDRHHTLASPLALTFVRSPPAPRAGPCPV